MISNILLSQSPLGIGTTSCRAYTTTMYHARDPKDLRKCVWPELTTIISYQMREKLCSERETVISLPKSRDSWQNRET